MENEIIDFFQQPWVPGDIERTVGKYTELMGDSATGALHVYMRKDGSSQQEPQLPPQETRKGANEIQSKRKSKGSKVQNRSQYNRSQSTIEQSTEIKACVSKKVRDSDDPVDTLMGEMPQNPNRICNVLNLELMKEPRS